MLVEQLTCWKEPTKPSQPCFIFTKLYTQNPSLLGTCRFTMFPLAIFILTIFSFGYCSPPKTEHDEAALKNFMMRNNRLPNFVELEKQKTLFQNLTNCEQCKRLIFESKKLAKNPQDMAKLKQILNSQICQLSILVGRKKQCQDTVNDFAIIFTRIMEKIQDIPVALVCRELQYCPDETDQESRIRQRLALLIGFTLLQQVHPERAYLDRCGECSFIVSEAKILVQSPSFRVQVKRQLDGLCRVTGSYQGECEAWADRGADLVFQTLLALLANQRGICVYLGICHSKNKRFLDQWSSTRNNGVSTLPLELHGYVSNLTGIRVGNGIHAGCLICQALIEMITQNDTADAIANYLSDIVCIFVPSRFEPGCIDFVKIYGGPLLQMIISEYSLGQICSAMHACTTEDRYRINQLPSPSKSSVYCESCHVLTDYITFELQQADFQQTIVNILKRGCTIMPGRVSEKVRCQSMLELYAPYYMENVIGPIIQSKLCPALGICNTAHQSMQVILEK